MTTPEQIRQQLPEHTDGIEVTCHEPMARHTSFRAGGTADVFVRVMTREALVKSLAFFTENGIPFVIVGNGSNLLVSDAGYHGAVIVLSGTEFSKITVQGERILAGAGAMLSDVARAAREHALDGMSALFGIPGTVGGALYMNAGAFGTEIKDVLRHARILDLEGERIEERVLDNAACHFGYRTSIAKEKKLCFLEGSFTLTPGDAIQIEDRMQMLLQTRKDKQPLEYPSAGSTFKRPPEGFAGQMIMEAGLSGTRIGDAEVSEKHCGFLINKGKATATDIWRLMQLVTKKVEETHGVRLVPEVILLGEFEACV